MKTSDRIHQDRRLKLIPSQRAELLRAVHKAEETQQQIADRFGMSQSYVSRVAQDAHAIFDLLDRWHLSEAELADELSWED